MKNEPEDLIERHDDLQQRVSASQEKIAEVEAKLAAPIEGGDIDRKLKAAAKQRADLAEQKAELEILQRMLCDVSSSAREAVDTLDRESDKAFDAWQRDQAKALSDLLRSDEAAQVREFMALAQWLFKSSGQNRFTPLGDTAEWKSTFDVSDDVAKAAADKRGVHSNHPVRNHALIRRLTGISEQNLQPATQAATPSPRPNNTHVTASDADKDAVRQKVKAQLNGPAPIHVRGGNASL